MDSGLIEEKGKEEVFCSVAIKGRKSYSHD